MNKDKKAKIIGSGILGTIAVLGGALAVTQKIKKNRIEKLLEREIYTNGKIRKFGTLYLDDEKQKKPSDFHEFNDISVHKGQKIEIRDTDKNDDYKLSWIEINEDNKKLLICDRNILKEISWDELNNQSLIFGKVVIIEDKKYILRLLTGADGKNDIRYNEWDKYIVNINNLLELPAASSNEVVNGEFEDSIDLENNNLWHWYNFSSFTQSENLKNKKQCIIRGLNSAVYSNQLDKEFKYETVGYRPVLELIE